ncbi:alpha-mannosidase 2C1-like [Hyalella azteca]|uniref:alpha-mannosidase n=1 Tax=Hyalella azteca TaxID=294128 RepID=A0A8B7PFM7_HYAAZ|nr:alpha-mannosidase 2C1-like [Hyalella azteca]
MADPGVQAPLHKNAKATRPRIDNFINSKRFKEVNLLNLLYPATTSADLTHWALPGGNGAWEKWTFSEIIKQQFTPTKVGTNFGPTWATHWFKVVLTLPEAWKGKQIRFRWDSGSEATLWSSDGRVLQGFSSANGDQFRTDYVITPNFDGSEETLTYYVEMASSRILGTTNGDEIDPPPTDKTFTLTRAEAAVFDTTVYKLTRDLEVLHQLSTELASDTIGYMALFTANQMVNHIIAGKEKEASDLADLYFSKSNGARAHNLAAIGNCHIDSAWLWTYSETKRKVARSFSSQLQLMDKYPEFIFVASQAQQWAWCKEFYPELFDRIKERVSQGRFLPVGGTWVEMDGNIPSGESFVRQFLHGQGFFEKELGVRCREFWLPDTFGYSPQIPGIMRHVGLNRFLTQKMSWSFVNKFPHHNFTWEGIDGSKVLAHFPPGDSYSMNCNVKEALHTEANLRDKGRASTSAFLFGYGDGGGGPTEDMIERARRLADADGCPRMQMTTPDALFSALEKEQHNFAVWRGELYLELHNGTYTSQAAMKRLCREAEFALRDAEFLLCMASAGGKGGDLLIRSLVELDAAWKKVMLNQFHDVLPGSGIEMIYPEATKLYHEAIAAADTVWKSSAITVLGDKSTSGRSLWDASIGSFFRSGDASQLLAFNTLQWPRRDVVTVPTSEGDPKDLNYALVAVPAFGFAVMEAAAPTNPVTLSEVNGSYILSNGLVRAVISSLGQLTSLAVGEDVDRDVFMTSDGQQLTGNRILLYDDQPLYWDAWDVMDYHLETETCINDATVSTPVSIKEHTALRCTLSWGCSVGRSSSLLQEISLSADSPYVAFKTSVNWTENRKLLKLGFNTSLKTTFATYDTQFGSLARPTVVNTSWDSARYEVCGHKYADLSESDWGLAVLNDSKYGWSGRDSTLTLTLLKSPKAPDANCDMGEHSFAYAVMPHAGPLFSSDVVQRSYEFNNPLKIMTANNVAPSPASMSWCAVVGAGVVLHTVKPAQDGSGDVILRVYESRGTRSNAQLQLMLPVKGVVECNGMEDPGKVVDFVAKVGGVSFLVKLTAYDIRAFRISF